MIWRKSNAMPTDKRHRYSQCFEYMFVWTKGKVSTFNALTEPARTHRTYKSNWGRKDDKMIHGVGKKRQTNAFKIRDNVFTYAISKGGATNDTIAWKHNAIYPEQLAHDHIISWSNEGDTVLDPFMGSGTTGKMAKQLNRNFIGIELDKEYYEIAKARIN
jgi:site-specific DNA-methyltransferase (adenine-specific)